MANLVLTAMIAPNDTTTYIDPRGSPIRGVDTGASAGKTLHVVHVRPADVAFMTAKGFRAAVAADLRPGHATTLDVGWPEQN